MTSVVAGLFAGAMVITMDLTERNLASEAMEEQLAFVLSLRDAGSSVEIGPNTRYLDDRDPSWSAWLDSLPDGFHDATKQGAEVHVFLQTQPDGRHALLYALEEFERREEIMERFALLGFFASVALALGLGVLTANRVIAPVVRLSRQVRRRDQLLSLAPPLATDYADDEVGRLAAAFDETLGRLREVLDRERLFTSDLSHEIRTPLMVIASSCELVRAQLTLTPGLDRQLDKIERAVREMRELTDTLLRLAREPSPDDTGESTGLREAAQQQVERWQPEADRRGLALRLHGTTGEDRLPAALLHTVMGNLLRNALRYTEQGFVAIELREDGFSVVDSGIGIPPGEQHKVFTPFFRGDNTRGDGVGIGLSLVQRICAREGWHLELRAPPDGGCEFRIELRARDTCSRNLHESPTLV